jgi:hypothetical protein
MHIPGNYRSAVYLINISALFDISIISMGMGIRALKQTKDVPAKGTSGANLL